MGQRYVVLDGIHEKGRLGGVGHMQALVTHIKMNALHIVGQPSASDGRVHSPPRQFTQLDNDQ